MRSAKGISWDLTDLYPSADSPGIGEDLERARSKALEFSGKYRSLCEAARIEGFPIASLLSDYKEIVTIAAKPSVYSQLNFSVKTGDPECGALLQKTRVAVTEIYTHLLFFEVFWKRLAESDAAKILRDVALEPDRHFLSAMRRYAPHTLSEGEERVMAVKADTGSGAFSRLFDETVNGISFYLKTGGRCRPKNEAQILSLLYSGDRAVRKRAATALAEGLQANSRLLSYIYNMILADHRKDLELRRYTHPMDPMNLANEVDTAAVMNLIRSVKAAYPLAARYYRLKKKLLKLDKLYDWDRYAPVADRARKVPFDRCRDLVLAAYQDFSGEAGRIVSLFFDRKWIDAEVRPGKQGGGFCCRTIPELHPYILVNYTGNPRDMMTVAHELGHGLHQYLAAERVGILEGDAPLVMAETASVFGEMLVFERILAEEADPRNRLALLCEKIDDHFATVFRQVAMTDFELKVHEEGRRGGELTARKLEELWIESNREFYGTSVVLTEGYRHGWKYIPHFVHTPFYCYAYAFAQLFVLSLYRKYRQDPPGFVPNYLEMLSLGGSRPPRDIAAMAGLDIGEKDFWKDGIGLLEEMVLQAESLAERSVRR